MSNESHPSSILLMKAESFPSWSIFQGPVHLALSLTRPFLRVVRALSHVTLLLTCFTQCGHMLHSDTTTREPYESEGTRLLLPSFFYECLRDGSPSQLGMAGTMVSNAASDYSVPLSFVLNLNNMHWTHATVTLATGVVTYTDCRRGRAPPQLSSGIMELRKGLLESASPGATRVDADHASMPRQDDNSSCGPLASFAMHCKAAGRPVAMNAAASSEVSVPVRVVQASLVAGLLTAREAGEKLWCL